MGNGHIARLGARPGARPAVHLGLLLLLAGLLAAAPEARALSWSFEPATYTPAATDSVEITAVLLNDGPIALTSVEVLSTVFSLGNVDDEYDVAFFGGVAQADVFENLDLGVGESTSFLFATLDPLGGSVPAGSYAMSAAFLRFNTDQGITTSLASDNLFTVDVAVVPEPGSLALAGAGLLLLAGWRRRARPA